MPETKQRRLETFPRRKNRPSETGRIVASGPPACPTQAMVPFLLALSANDLPITGHMNFTAIFFPSHRRKGILQKGGRQTMRYQIQVVEMETCPLLCHALSGRSWWWSTNTLHKNDMIADGGRHLVLACIWRKPDVYIYIHAVCPIRSLEAPSFDLSFPLQLSPGFEHAISQHPP